MRNSERKGFTLIEILIVVAIIGILASIAIVGLGPIQKRGRDARRISDLRSIQNGLELYFSKCGYYPGGAVAAGAACPAFAAAANYTAMVTAIKSTPDIAIRAMPADPLSSNPAYTYTYNTGGSGTAYVISATLEDTTNSALSDPSRFQLNAPGAPPAGSFGVNCTAAGVLCQTL